MCAYDVGNVSIFAWPFFLKKSFVKHAREQVMRFSTAAKKGEK